MLELAGNGEGGKDESEDKDVVDRQGVLDDVTRQVLDGRRWAANDEEAEPEEDRQGDPDARPGERLPARDDVRLAVEDPEIEGQGAEDEDEEARTEKEGRVEVRNRVPPDGWVERWSAGIVASPAASRQDAASAAGGPLDC